MILYVCILHIHLVFIRLTIVTVSSNKNVLALLEQTPLTLSHGSLFIQCSLQLSLQTIPKYPGKHAEKTPQKKQKTDVYSVSPVMNNEG